MIYDIVKPADLRVGYRLWFFISSALLIINLATWMQYFAAIRLVAETGFFWVPFSCALLNAVSFAITYAIKKNAMMTACGVEVTDESLKLTTISGAVSLSWQDLKIRWARFGAQYPPVYLVETGTQSYWIPGYKDKQGILLEDLRTHAGRRNLFENQRFALTKGGCFHVFGLQCLAQVVSSALLLSIMCAIGRFMFPWPAIIGLSIGAGLMYFICASVFVCRSIDISHDKVIVKTLTKSVELVHESGLQFKDHRSFGIISSNQGPFYLPTYLHDYDLCGRMLMNFSTHSGRGKKNIFPGLVSAAACTATTLAFILAPLNMVLWAGVLAITAALIDFCTTRNSTRLWLCILLWSIPFCSFLSVPHAALATASSLQRCVTACQNPDNLTPYVELGPPVRLAEYEIKPPRDLVPTKMYSDHTGYLQTWQGACWDSPLPDHNLTFLAGRDLTIMSDKVTPVNALPKGQGKSMPEEVCCLWTQQHGVKKLSRRSGGCVRLANLKFDVFYWSGEYNGRAIIGKDYIAQDGDHVVAVRCSDAQGLDRDIDLRLNAVLHSLRKL